MRIAVIIGSFVIAQSNSELKAVGVGVWVIIAICFIMDIVEFVLKLLEEK
jgi:hypothetical protein